jgi:hypothetical protein
MDTSTYPAFPTVVFPAETDEGELEMRCSRFGHLVQISRTSSNNVLVIFKHHKVAREAFEKLSGSYKCRLFLDGFTETEEGGISVDNSLNNGTFYNSNITLQPGSLVGKMPEVIDWQIPRSPVSKWSASLDFLEQLRDYRQMERKDFHNRYLVLGNFTHLISSNTVGKKIPSVLLDYLKTISGGNEITEIEVFDLSVANQNLFSMETEETTKSPPLLVAHLTFKSTKAASQVLSTIPEPFLVAFGPPRAATKKIWFACAAFPVIRRDELQKIASSFGPVEEFGYFPERGCAFANYIYEKDAIKARNTLYAVDCTTEGGWSMNADFVPQDKRDLERNDRMNRDRSRSRSPNRGRDRRSRSRERRSSRDRHSRERERRGDHRSDHRSDRSINLQPRSSQPDETSRPLFFNLFKMGEKMGEVKGKVVEGSSSIASGFFRKLFNVNVDQRTKIDHLKARLSENGDKIVIEVFSTANSSIEQFCSYFIDKERLGYLTDAGWHVYFIPTTRQFMEPIGIDSRAPLMIVMCKV